jgi:hypothetical protein
LTGEEFDVLGRVMIDVKVEVGEIDGAEKGVVGDDRVEEDVDGRERGDLGGGRAGERRGETVTTRSAANTAVYARRVAALGALGAGEVERGGGPLLLRRGVVVRGSVVDEAEGPGSLDELDELVVASLQPLQTVGLFAPVRKLVLSNSSSEMRAAR